MKRQNAPVAAGAAAELSEQQERCSSSIVPAALAVRKRGRVCVVAKLVRVGGEVALATTWRSQRGCQQAVSLPDAVIKYARVAGARRYYLRDDRARRMWTCPIELFEQARPAADGECYVLLSQMTPTAWRSWEYAERVVVLEHHPARRLPGQPALELGAAYE